MTTKGFFQTCRKLIIVPTWKPALDPKRGIVLTWILAEHSAPVSPVRAVAQDVLGSDFSGQSLSHISHRDISYPFLERVEYASGSVEPHDGELKEIRLELFDIFGLRLHETGPFPGFVGIPFGWLESHGFEA